MVIQEGLCMIIGKYNVKVPNDIFNKYATPIYQLDENHNIINKFLTIKKASSELNIPLTSIGM